MRLISLVLIAPFFLANQNAQAQGPAVGAKVPDFRLPGVDGNFHALETEGDHKATVVVFWSNRCQFCRGFEPRLVKMANEFKPRKIRFIAVSCGDYYTHDAESFPKMKERAASANYPFPYLLDTAQSVARAYRIRYTPTVFVVAPDRTLLYHGAIDRTPQATSPSGYLQSALEEIADDQPVSVTNTDVQGFNFELNAYLFAPPAARTLRPGDQIPALGLLGIDGNFVSLRVPKDKIRKTSVFIFSCNTCPVVHAYEERMIALAREFAGPGGGVDFYLINPNDPGVMPGDDFDKMKQRAREKGYPFPYLFDSTQTVARAFGATCTPHVFVADRLGFVRYEGAIDDNQDPDKVEHHYLRDALKALTSGSMPNPASTEQFGCSIKWKQQAAD
jgi:peroxiredoxin